MNTKRILVVDDDEGILDAISMFLAEEGYTVSTTPKGEETYKKIDEFHPDVILLDVLMSGSDGRDICRKLKRDEKTRKIPVIMISAHPSAAKSVFEFGADDFLAKPFETEELILKVTQYF
jgi:DNA-binding response OmpR family regulator